MHTVEISPEIKIYCKNWKLWDAYQMGRFLQTNPDKFRFGRYVYDFVALTTNEHGTPIVELKGATGIKKIKYLNEVWSDFVFFSSLTKEQQVDLFKRHNLAMIEA